MRTSCLEHKIKVQQIFSKLLEQDNIYLDLYKGYYCLTCEEYVIQKNNIICDFCKTKLKFIQESAYFIRISKYKD